MATPYQDQSDRS